MEIRDWWLARELDVVSAMYLREEQVKEAVERDREFWIAMFGGSQTDDEETTSLPLEDLMTAGQERRF